MKRTPILTTLIAGALLVSSQLFGYTPRTYNVDIPYHDFFQYDNTYEGYKTCAGCHDAWAPSFANHIKNLMESSHWDWQSNDGNNPEDVGKINVINNFCVAVVSNEPRCTSCHIGIGWSDDSYDLSEANYKSIDCFVCHDGSGTYAKYFKGAGAPVDGLDYDVILKSFQRPDRDNCGQCHFNGGGAEGVKHGTMDGSLSTPDRSTDVHMSNDTFTCVTCHTHGLSSDVDEEGYLVDAGKLMGSRNSQDVTDDQLCVSCHINAWGPKPFDAHAEANLLGDHFSVLSCQACHVPALARGGKPTKMFWDWSTAGQGNVKVDGAWVDYVEKDPVTGWVTYHSKKGHFEWGVNVVPEYMWSNGKFNHVTVGNAPVNEGGVTQIQTFFGGPGDGKIFPVKRFVGIQPYDVGTKQLAVPNLFPGGTKADSDEPDSVSKNAYWMAYNWEKALSSGMRAVGLDWVGPVGWATSEYNWIANHMVAPAEDAVGCIECHTSFGRMDFAALGLNAGLQKFMDNDVWAGYPLEDGPIIDTGDWLGVVDISGLPIVKLENGDEVYLPNEEILRLQRMEGIEDWAGFKFVDGPYYDTGDWLGTVYMTQDTYPWAYVFKLGRYVMMPNEAFTPSGNWGYIPF